VLSSGAELVRAQAPVLALMVAWTAFPIVALVVWVTSHGGVLTGANGYDTFDQMQYLAWIHDAGSHVLASNLWRISATPHDYLQPMYLVSAGIWRLGVPLPVAYMVFKPVALAVLFLGCAWYSRHLLPQSRWMQMAALLIAVFYLSPVLQLAIWTGHLSVVHRFELVLATDDADPSLGLWGLEHVALTVGLMPVYLICVESVLQRGLAGARGRAVAAALAGAAVSWLHPWQGAMLLIITAAAFVLAPPRRRYLGLTGPVIATLLPLVYGLALSHYDSSWHYFEQQTIHTIGASTAPWWALLASFGVPAAFAVVGVRRTRELRWLLLYLWIAACALVYVVVPEYPPHALTGITVPLGILAVRGWDRTVHALRVPAPAAAVAALAALALAIVPGAVDQINSTIDYTHHSAAGAAQRQLVVLTDDQHDAMRFLATDARPGGVLAPYYLSMTVPGQTGRRVFAGHEQWTDPRDVSATQAFYSPALHDPTGAFRRGILHESGATFVIEPCGAPTALRRALAPVTTVAGRFGCLTVVHTR
jgi:hypothetical protein